MVSPECNHIVETSIEFPLVCPNAAGSQSRGRKRSASFSTPNNNGTSSGACYKCGEEGHFSNGSLCLFWSLDVGLTAFAACPDGASKKPRSMATPSNGACYKCGQEGHFSNGKNTLVF